MKNIKKCLLALVLMSTINLLPYHDDGFGGFAPGFLVGTGVALAATSGNRYQDPETANIRSYDRRIRETERNLRRAEKDADKGKAGAQERVERYQAELKRLNKERSMITA